MSDGLLVHLGSLPVALLLAAAFQDWESSHQTDYQGVMRYKLAVLEAVLELG